MISMLHDDTIHMVACSTDVETSSVSVCNVGGELKPSSRVQKKLDDLCGHWTEEHGELEGFSLSNSVHSSDAEDIVVILRCCFLNISTFEWRSDSGGGMCDGGEFSW